MPQNFSVNELKKQARHVDNVMKWIKSLAYNIYRLNKIKKGTDTSGAFTEERINSKIQKLMDHKYSENKDFLESSDIKRKLLDLEDEMDIYRPLVMSSNNPEYHHKLSDLGDEEKRLNIEFGKSLEKIDPKLFEFS